MPAWPEPPDHGRKQSRCVLAVTVPDRLQKLQQFKTTLEAIAERSQGEIEVKLYFRISGDMKLKELEALKIEIEHAAGVCGTGVIVQTTHFREGMEQPIIQTTRIKARAAKEG